MASAADVLLVSLLAAVAPVVLFVLLRKGQGKGAEKGTALLTALRERLRWLSSASASSTATPHHHPMLTRVAPSEHGFLPARVPDFSFDNAILDGFVQVRKLKGTGSWRFRVNPNVFSTSVVSLARSAVCPWFFSLLPNPDLF